MLLRILVVIALILAAAVATTAAIAVAPQNGKVTHKSQLIGSPDDRLLTLAVAR